MIDNERNDLADELDYLAKGENEENYVNILEEYNTAIENKKFMISKLYDEIKIIKKLKV